jgi:hypothetical protein
MIWSVVEIGHIEISCPRADPDTRQQIVLSLDFRRIQLAGVFSISLSPSPYTSHFYLRLCAWLYRMYIPQLILETMGHHGFRR